MAETKLDRRVHRTRRALREALQELALEKGFDAVTVEELAERANVGRTTFYLHYRDKDDLLFECVGSLVDDLVASISDLPMSAWKLADDNPAEPIALTFEHAADHADLYRLLLRGEGTFPMAKRLRSIIIGAARDFLQYKIDHDKLGLDPAIPMDAFSSYLAGSWTGTISWWLENDLPYPPREMASIFQKMFYRGALGVLQIDDDDVKPGGA
jgi:AcrR family transcriptional regulator